MAQAQAQSAKMDRSPRPKENPWAGKTEKNERLGMLEKFASNPRLAAFMLNTAIGLLSQEDFGRALAGGAKGLGDFMSAEMKRLKEEEAARAAMAAKGGGGGRGGSGGAGASSANGSISITGGVKIDPKEFDKVYEAQMKRLEDSGLSWEEMTATATVLTYQYFGESMPATELRRAQEKLAAATEAGDQAAMQEAQWERNELLKMFTSWHTTEPALAQFYKAQALAAAAQEEAQANAAAGLPGQPSAGVTEPGALGGVENPATPAVVDPLAGWGTGVPPNVPEIDNTLAGMLPAGGMGIPSPMGKTEGTPPYGMIPGGDPLLNPAMDHYTKQILGLK